MKNIQLGLLASGTGSNIKVLYNYFCNHPSIKVSLLITNRVCGANDIAEEAGIETMIFSNELWLEGKEINTFLSTKKIDFLVLAGFLRKIPAIILHTFPNRIINLHPSLLPKFGGEGMYGKYVHNEVIKSNEKNSGISVHLVSDNYDEGQLLEQVSYELVENETAESLGKAIQKLEHENYPRIIEQFISSKLQHN
jgi:phosphoribosylglycinamide formyltransferase-1